jgi:VWFA-related protein
LEKPFTVALVLDTSGSTVFKLDDIKEAAIRFAGQLRPQDRVLVVTFNDDVLLLTEATNDRAVINHVIERHAQSGSSTRLYDALDLLIKKRLNRIKGRKAIVLFTDGVDTGSSLATYRSTLETAEELDALIYPIQYDTLDDNVQAVGGAPGGSGNGPRIGRPYLGDKGTGTGTSTPRVQLGSSSEVIARVLREAYALGGLYLHGLADKTGGRLYRADDPAQLASAFSLIAEELRHQYSLGYYPKSAGSASLAAGTRRQIRVRVRRPGLAVRARDSYVTAGPRNGGASH